MNQQCYTCMGDHDPDEACRRIAQQPGRPVPTDDLFDAAEEEPRLGPVIIAQYFGEDECCGGGIGIGDEIRSDGQGGWIHASEACERMARE